MGDEQIATAAGNHKELRVRKALMAVAVLMGGCQALGQGMPGARARADAVGAVERRALAIDARDPAWQAAAVQGVSAREVPLVIPGSLPGEPFMIGVNSKPPGGAISAASAGVKAVEGKSLVWRVRVDAPGADGVRLKLTGLDLGPGESVVVAGRDKGYVIRGRGANGTGVEWTPVLEGEHGFVEWQGSVPRLTIEEVAEIVWPRGGGGETDLLPCHVDVQCETVDAVARDSVGRVVYSTPLGTFLCTAALLNDADVQTTLGWLLTSSGCINTQSAAESVSVYWFYQTPACGGEAPVLGTLPVSQGANLVATSTSTSAALLKLAQDPSQGQGLAGWTAEEPTGVMTTIHHPEGSFKRIARGPAATSSPRCVGLYSHYQYHLVDYTVGITESGSEGAPLFDANWRVVGQLTGVCAFSTPTCSNPEQWNAVFGRFSRTLPLVRGFLTGQVSPARVYVDASATGAGTGLTWVDAYTSLGTALAELSVPAGGMEIWVANGTYKAVGAGREVAFDLVPGVAIYGGFAGGETLLSERNIVANIAVLSGDLAGDDGPGFVNRDDNALHVVRGTGVGSTAVLDGFRIRGGNANGSNAFDDKGGGLYVEVGSPRVRNCFFEDNLALIAGGGAAWFSGSVVDAAGCEFRRNRALLGAGASLTNAGGTLATSVFEQNTALNTGGALDLYESGPTVSECTFRSNTAVDRGGAIAAFGSSGVVVRKGLFEQNGARVGGAVHVSGGSVELRESVFVGNTAADFGGALLHRGGSQVAVSACRFLGNVSSDYGGAVHGNSGTIGMVNCELSGNRSVLSGGAMDLRNGVVLTLLQCTLSGNVAGTTGGGVLIGGGSAAVTNSILWGNTDGVGGGETAQVRLEQGATATLGYSLVEGWSGTLGGTGNIGGNPLFVSAAGPDLVVGTIDDDLALGAGSPARDAGNNGPVGTIATDLRGNARREDDPCTPDTGAGTAPIVDMGAIEGLACVNACYANCDGSTTPPVLTANDFVCFLEKYATAASYANCDGSTVEPVLTANDFVCFLAQYAIGCS